MQKCDHYVLGTWLSRSLIRFGLADNEGGYAVIDTRKGSVTQWIYSRSAARGWMKTYLPLTDEEVERRIRAGDAWASKRIRDSSPPPADAKSC